MSKRKLKKLKKKSRTSAPVESAGAETLTVAWMLCVAIGLVCDVGAIFVRWFLPDYTDSVNLQVLFALLAFSALVVGTLSLCLLPVVLKSRKVPPPPGIVVFAIIVGVMPLLTLAIGLAR